MDGLREFLIRLEERGELIHIRKEVDPRFEVAALIRDIQQRRNRAVLFERVKGFAHPIVSNVCGSYANVATALGVEPSALSRTWAERISRAAALPAVEPRPGVYEASSLGRLPICTIARRPSASSGSSASPGSSAASRASYPGACSSWCRPAAH